jgi:carboxyl-terminal processing protease
MQTVGQRLLFLGGALALTLAAVTGLFLHDQRLHQVAAPPEIDGVWRSQGYGWLFLLQNGQLNVYDEVGSYCVESAEFARMRDALANGYELAPDRRSLRLSIGDPTYRFTFDRIAALPAACTRAPDASPPGVLDAIDRIFTAHYAFFAQRKVDWPALIGAAKAQVSAETPQQDLHDAVCALLSHIDDDHVSLSASVGGRRVECKTRAGADTGIGDLTGQWSKAAWTKAIEQELLDDGARTTANGAIKYGMIDGDIGFLSVSSMEDFADDGGDDAPALEAALDEAMQSFDGAKAVIVDLSVNDGGEDRLARRIASRFAAKRTRAYSKYAGDAKGAAQQNVYIEPAGPGFTGPVYLLTSNVTVSAAEIFTIAMRALPNVTHLGQTTRGALSDELTKRLPNGWTLSLSNEVYLDSAGKAWEGRGIPPSVPLPVFAAGEEPGQTHLQALRVVIDRINGTGSVGGGL